MRISTDQAVLFQNGFITINNTLLFSWAVMAILIVVAIVLKKSVSKDTQFKNKPTNLQNFFEALISCIETQIKQISDKKIEIVYPFIATLYLYIV